MSLDGTRRAWSRWTGPSSGDAWASTTQERRFGEPVGIPVAGSARAERTAATTVDPEDEKGRVR